VSAGFNLPFPEPGAADSFCSGLGLPGDVFYITFFIQHIIYHCLNRMIA
jgi:hypothetical protein